LSVLLFISSPCFIFHAPSVLTISHASLPSATELPEDTAEEAMR
jgi:hypothetical protein